MYTPAIPFIAVALLKSTLSVELYFALFFGFLFTHYIFAVTALKKKKISTKKLIIVGLLILLISFTFFKIGIPIDFYFGIHWLLAELYLAPLSKKTLLVRFSYLSVYYLLLYTEFFNSLINPWTAWSTSCVIFIIISGLSFLKKNDDQTEKVKKIALNDSFYFIFTGFSLYFWQTTFLDIIFLHLIQFSVAYSPSNHNLPIKRYVLNTGGLTLLLIVLFHPASPTFIGGLDIVNHAIFFGFIHITQSFFLSNQNPHFIREHIVRRIFVS